MEFGLVDKVFLCVDNHREPVLARRERWYKIRLQLLGEIHTIGLFIYILNMFRSGNGSPF